MRSLAVIVLAFLACRPVARVQTQGGFIRDTMGRALILRGVNVSTAQKVAPYLDFHDEAAFLRIRDEWGMNSVRFVTSWAAIEPEPGRYDEAYLAAVRERLQLVRRAGLYVIVDLHQDLFGIGFKGGDGMPRWACDDARYDAFAPRTPWMLGYLDPNVMACFDAFWSSIDRQSAYAEAARTLAAAIGENDAVLGIDVMNEPFWGSGDLEAFESSTLPAFYDRVLEAVRKERPEWLGFVEPSAARNLGLPSHLRAPKAERVVYAPHLYDPSAEQGEGFDDARRDALLANARALAEEARALGLPLWLGEYGAQASASGVGEYMDAVYDAAAAELAGTMYWHYGRDGTYGLQDSLGNDKAPLLDAIVRPYPQAIAGTPLAFSFDDRTRHTELTWAPDPALDVPTLIGVPERAYPGGYRVTCDACTFFQDGATLVVVEQGSGQLGLDPL